MNEKREIVKGDQIQVKRNRQNNAVYNCKEEI